MDLEIGQEIDGYKIRGILGRGGMGIVYEAEDVALSRAVALKAINPGLTKDEQFIRRFQTEARVLGRSWNKSTRRQTGRSHSGHSCGERPVHDAP